jgi:hypothetical protein
MALMDVLVYVAAVFLMCAIPCWDARRRGRAAAKAQHPASWSDATEAAIVQAVGDVDDGRALVRETEAFLEGRSR